MPTSYYVYLHTTKTGTPFYVGCGTTVRAYDFKNRNAEWKKVAKEGVIVRLLTKALPKLRAVKEEKRFILVFGDTLINKHKGKTKPKKTGYNHEYADEVIICFRVKKRHKKQLKAIMYAEMLKRGYKINSKKS